jgi:putative membrane protein
MEVLNNLLLWVHFIGLAMGGAATFGIPMVAAQMAGAGPEARPALLKAMMAISKVSRAGLGALIVTGLLLVWLKFGGASGFTWWFWLKMALVVALIAAVVYAGINAKAAAGGDAAAARRGPRIGMVSLVLLLGIVLSAVFAFN